MQKILLVLCLLTNLATALSQQLLTLTQGTSTSIRGLSVVTDSIIWVSGSKGMVGRSVNAGASWIWTQVPGYEKREFRDIEAFDSLSALILTIAEPGVILRTNDGGQTWKPVYSDTSTGIFLDAFHFGGNGQGTVIGDPLGGQVYIATTRDNGNTWERNLQTQRSDSGEACFASSGTNIVTLNDGTYFFVTGGLTSRIHGAGSATRLPMVQGKESRGANSLAISGTSAVVVGGDFASDSSSAGNCVLIDISRRPKFSVPSTPPHGYRSCVEFINPKHLITCGTSGVDISFDAGRHWQLITRESFHVCQKAKKGNLVYLAGANGRVARYENR